MSAVAAACHHMQAILSNVFMHSLVAMMEQDQQMDIVPAEHGGLACHSSGGVFLGESDAHVDSL